MVIVVKVKSIENIKGQILIDFLNFLGRASQNVIGRNVFDTDVCFWGEKMPIVQDLNVKMVDLEDIL